MVGNLGNVILFEGIGGGVRRFGGVNVGGGTGTVGSGETSSSIGIIWAFGVGMVVDALYRKCGDLNDFFVEWMLDHCA
jgi:hypothetical protein